MTREKAKKFVNTGKVLKNIDSQAAKLIDTIYDDFDELVTDYANAIARETDIREIDALIDKLLEEVRR